MTIIPKLTLPALLLLGAACATTGRAGPPAAKLVIVQLTPPKGAKVAAGTPVLVVGHYSVDRLEFGKDRVSVHFGITTGRVANPRYQLLAQAEGRVAFELSGADLLRGHAPGHPLRVFLVLDRVEASGQIKMLAASEAVMFEADRREPKPAEPAIPAPTAPLGPPADVPPAAPRFLPPGVGKGQLLSDMQHDARYRPRLPPELNFAGMVVWGLFKLCVDSEGQVASVQLLKSADPLVDDDWVAILRTLQHRPYTIGGRPVPYCYPMRLEVRSMPDPKPPQP